MIKPYIVVAISVAVLVACGSKSTDSAAKSSHKPTVHHTGNTVSSLQTTNLEHIEHTIATNSVNTGNIAKNAIGGGTNSGDGTNSGNTEHTDSWLESLLPPGPVYGGKYFIMYNEEGCQEHCYFYPSLEDEFILNGKKFSLSSEPSHLQWKEGSQKLKYVRFGGYEDPTLRDDNNPKWSLFYFGEYTKMDKIPTTGSAVEYRGTGVYAIEDQGFTALDANFTVNFEQKYVTGKLENRTQGLIFDISRMDFNGGAALGGYIDYKFNGDRAYLIGTFMGPNAEELGGVLHGQKQGKKFAAAFGATRQ